MINQSEMGVGMTLVYAGHFGMEKSDTNLLTERFSAVLVFSAEREKDPFRYV